MTRLRYAKQKMLFVFVAAVILCGGVCHAAEFKDLRAVKQEAWKHCEWNAWGIPAEQQEVHGEVDGAVREGGEIYLSVTQWEDKGISKGGELPIFGSKTSDIVIGTLNEETIVSVLEQDKDKALIQSGYVSGYVESSRLLRGEQAREQADKVCPEQVITDGTKTEGYRSVEEKEVLCYLQQRHSYDIIEKMSGWYRISTEYFGNPYVKSSGVKLVRKTRLASLNHVQDTAEIYREIEVSEAERECLAAIVWCEAGNDPFDGQVAVASTVFNRIDSSLFPDTVESVIRQRGQFIPVQTGWYDEVMRDPAVIPVSCFEAVDYVLQGNRTVDTLYFNQAGVGKEIGSHWFY